MSVIYKMVHSRETARDIAQESFMRLWQKYQHINDIKKSFYILYRIAINISIDHLRKVKNLPFKMNSFIDEKTAYSDDINEIYEIVIRCTSELKPKQKAVFVLRDVEGFDFSEISDILKMPVENVRSNLSLARRNIKNLLEIQYNITQEFLYEL